MKVVFVFVEFEIDFDWYLCFVMIVGGKDSFYGVDGGGYWYGGFYVVGG